jgi:hypothetical protein
MPDKELVRLPACRIEAVPTCIGRNGVNPSFVITPRSQSAALLDRSKLGTAIIQPME